MESGLTSTARTNILLRENMTKRKKKSEPKTFHPGDSVSFIALIQDAGGKGKSRKINVSNYSRKDDINNTYVRVTLEYPKTRITDEAYMMQKTSIRVSAFYNSVDGKRDGMLQAKLVEEKKLYLITPANLMIYKKLIDFLLEYDDKTNDLENNLNDFEHLILNLTESTIVLENEDEETIQDIKEDKTYTIDSTGDFAFLKQEINEIGINVFKEKFFTLRNEYDGIKQKLKQLKDQKSKEYENHKNQLAEKYGQIPNVIDELAKEDIEESWTRNIYDEHVESLKSSYKGGKKSKRGGDWKTLRK